MYMAYGLPWAMLPNDFPPTVQRYFYLALQRPDGDPVIGTWRPESLAGVIDSQSENHRKRWSVRGFRCPTYVGLIVHAADRIATALFPRSSIDSAPQGPKLKGASAGAIESHVDTAQGFELLPQPSAPSHGSRRRLAIESYMDSSSPHIRTPHKAARKVD